MPEPLPGSAFEHKRARNDAVEIHYVVAGRGEAVVLLHGFPETWFGWRKKPVALASVRAKPPYLQYSNSPGRRDLSSRSQSPFSCSRLLIFPGYSAGIHCPNSSTTGNLSRISEPGSLFERRTLRISSVGLPTGATMATASDCTALMGPKGPTTAIQKGLRGLLKTAARSWPSWLWLWK